MGHHLLINSAFSKVFKCRSSRTHCALLSLSSAFRNQHYRSRKAVLVLRVVDGAREYGVVDPVELKSFIDVNHIFGAYIVPCEYLIPIVRRVVVVIRIEVS